MKGSTDWGKSRVLPKEDTWKHTQDLIREKIRVKSHLCLWYWCRKQVIEVGKPAFPLSLLLLAATTAPYLPKAFLWFIFFLYMPACTFLKVCKHSCALGRICTVTSNIKASCVSVEEIVMRATHSMWKNPANLEKDQADAWNTTIPNLLPCVRNSSLPPVSISVTPRKRRWRRWKRRNYLKAGPGQWEQSAGAWTRERLECWGEKSRGWNPVLLRDNSEQPSLNSPDRCHRLPRGSQSGYLGQLISWELIGNAHCWDPVHIW